MAEQAGPASGRSARRVLTCGVVVALLAIALLAAGWRFGWSRMDAVGALAGVWGAIAAVLFGLAVLYRREDRELHRADLTPVYPLDPLDIDQPRPWPVSAVAAAVAFRLDDTPYQVLADHQMIVVAGGPSTFKLGIRKVTRSFRLTLLAGREGEFEQVCHDHSRDEVPGERTFVIKRSGSPPRPLAGSAAIGDRMSTRHVMGPLRHALEESGWRAIPRRWVLNWVYPVVFAPIVVIAAIPLVLSQIL